MKYKTFPFSLLRSGGDTFDKLEMLKFSRSPEIAQFILNEEKILHLIKGQLCNRIHDYIGEIENYDTKKELIKLKRDVFNLRQICEKRGGFDDLTPYDLSVMLYQYRESLVKISSSKEQLKIIYYQEFFESRKAFKSVVDNDDFFSGLILGSNNLLSEAEKFLKKDDKHLKDKISQIEVGLMRYFSRMVAKTSPFSRFTNVSFIKHSNELFNECVGAKTIESYVRPNNYILKFFKSILTKYKPFYLNEYLNANTTIKEIDSTKIVFLLNVNNSEAFTEVEYTELLKLLLEFIAENKEVRFCNLLDFLLVNVDASKKNLEQYILRMIEHGIIEYSFKVSVKDIDWISSLVKYIKFINPKDSELQKFCDSLNIIDFKINEYSKSSNYISRRDILNDLHSEFYKAYLSLHKKCKLPKAEFDLMIGFSGKEMSIKKPGKKSVVEEKIKVAVKENNHKVPVKQVAQLLVNESSLVLIKPERMVYEDTILMNRINLPKTAVNAAVSLLSRLNNSLNFLLLNSDSKLKYKLFFKAKYPSFSEVSLLSFYDNYNRELKEGRLDATINPMGVNLFDNFHLDEWIKKMSELVKAKNKKNIINFTHEELCKIKPPRKESDASKGIPSSFSALIQATAINGEVSEDSFFIMNTPTLQGNGKFLSRFLYYNADEVLKEIIADNKPFDQDTLFVESNDNSFFNANIHPPLTDYELLTPGGHSTLSFKGQVHINNVMIKYDSINDELYAYDKVQSKKVIFLDLDFQDLGSRSPLFKLLYNFSVEQPPNFFHFFSNIIGLAVSKMESNNIIFRPRVVFEDKLVISRMSWEIPKSELPLMLENNDEVDNYMLIKKWQMNINFPDEFFVNMVSLVEQVEMKPNDNAKPQYISLNNPILVSLFIKNYLKCRSNFKLILSEFFPEKKDMITIGGRSFVSEWVIQWSECNTKHSA